MIDERFILQLNFDLLFERPFFYFTSLAFFYFLFEEGKVTSGTPFFAMPFYFELFWEFTSI
jgi:hypothetical protein